MLPCLLAAPTLVRIGGVPYLARPLTLGGFALLLRAAGDDFGMDGDGGDLPAFGSDEFQAWIGAAGAPLLFWECLKRDEPGLTMARCEGLAEESGTDGAGILLRLALRRARTAMPPEGEGQDIARLDWAAMIFRRYEESHQLPAAVAGLTLDQAWLIASGGKGFDVPDEGRAVLDDMQRQWTELYGEKTEPAPTAPEVRSVEDDLKALGLEIVPGDNGNGG
jgi:hypothetical protein